MQDNDRAKMLLEYRNSEPSFLKSLLKSWKLLLFRLIMILIMLHLYINENQTPLFLLIIGLLLGGTLQDLSWMLRFNKAWKFTERIIDWKKVDDIAKK